MSDSEIMLAVTYDPDKVSFPVEISIKLDGVAADFYYTPNGWVAQSRQGKPLPSVGHILSVLNKNAKRIPAEIGLHIVGELTVVGVPNFKDAGGIIRRQEADKRIVMNIYDAYHPDFPDWTYEKRIEVINAVLKAMNGRSSVSEEGVEWSLIRRVPVVGLAASLEDISEHLSSIDSMMKSSSMFEGFMVRCLRGEDSKYKVGKRSRNMMRYKPSPTVDLEVVRFEEARANKTMRFLGDTYNKGDGLQAVGRIVCLYNGAEIGVGPGTLTHIERRALWERWNKAERVTMQGTGLIAEVEYMVDENYTALRQPTFKQWRTDKTEASEVA